MKRWIALLVVIIIVGLANTSDARWRIFGRSNNCNNNNNVRVNAGRAVQVQVNRNNQNRNNNLRSCQDRNGNGVCDDDERERDDRDGNLDADDILDNQLSDAADRLTQFGLLNAGLNLASTAPVTPPAEPVAPPITPVEGVTPPATPVVDTSKIDDLEKKLDDMLKEIEAKNKEIEELKNKETTPAPLPTPPQEATDTGEPAAPPKILYDIERRK